MDLDVIGRHALLFDDDASAEFVNSAAALVDWNSLCIDRYDVRNLLTSLPPRHRRMSESAVSVSSDVSEIELNHERYLDLPSGSEEPDAQREEERSGYHRVPFSYGNCVFSNEQMPVSGYHPPFLVPQNILGNMPPTEKIHQIMARTAVFVSKHGGQSEIVLRVKQGSNPTFGFLMPDHNLHPYFRFLVDHPELLGPQTDQASTKNEKESKNTSDQAAHSSSALSLLGSLYGHGPDDESADLDASLSEMCSVVTNQLDPDTGTKSGSESPKKPLQREPRAERKQGGDISSVEPKEPSPVPTSAQVLKESKEQQNPGSKHVLSLKERIDLLKSKHEAVLRKNDPCKMAGDGDSGLPIAEAQVLDPPSEMKRVMDRIIEFLLRNGTELESVLIQQDVKPRRFPFLLPTNLYHPYYRKALQKAQESKLSFPDRPLERRNSLRPSGELKKATNESEVSYASSDFPYDRNKNDKMKTVFEKRKDVHGPSNSTGQEIGVGVDVTAAAAILQAAARGIKVPDLGVLSMPGNNKPRKGEDKDVGPTRTSDSNLTRDKVKAMRLERAKMFAALIKRGSDPLRASVSNDEPKEANGSGVPEPGAREREERLEKIGADGGAEVSDDKQKRRRYRLRPNDSDEDEEETREKRKHSRRHGARSEECDEKYLAGEEEEDRDGESRHSKRSRHVSRHRREKHKHRKHHSSKNSRHHKGRHRHDSSSDEAIHSRHQHKDRGSLKHGERHSRNHDGGADSNDQGSSDGASYDGNHGGGKRKHRSSDDSLPRGGMEHGTSNGYEHDGGKKTSKSRRRVERESEVEEGEIPAKPEESKGNGHGRGHKKEDREVLEGSTQHGVKVSSSAPETKEVPDELRAKIRAMLVANL